MAAVLEFLLNVGEGLHGDVLSLQLISHGQARELQRQTLQLVAVEPTPSIDTALLSLNRCHNSGPVQLMSS